MRELIHRQLVSANPRASRIGIAFVFSLALVLGLAVARLVPAQSSQIRTAFTDSEKQLTGAGKPRPGTVRLASGQKAAATPSAKAAKAPVRKPKTATLPPPSESKASESAEDLPAMPLKAVLP